MQCPEFSEQDHKQQIGNVEISQASDQPQRLLADVEPELRDDRGRFGDARALKAYAGAAPVTRASGKTGLVMHRRVKNDRLAAVGYVCTFAALTKSKPVRAHYDRRRATGDRHSAALRNLFNWFLGQLHHCLQQSHTYDETRAFPALAA
jgi:hypothetical protein